MPLVVHVADFERPKLSICIATYNRGKYIADTIRAILDGLPAGVELVIVDGASPDDTELILAPFVLKNDAVRYFREASNSGVDRDFDKAVSYAQGKYCWLMSDDDILIPGAVVRVLHELESSVDLLVVNSQIRSVDLSAELSPRILEITSDRYYDVDSRDRFLGDVGDYLSFIGAVVIRRDIWLKRDRERYFGSLFVHVGVIFQAPLSRIKVLADPLIVIRLGNAMWTNRGFEIWMFKWPDLVWSFDGLAASAKLRVVAREPWRLWRRLVFYRAIGAYSYADYRKFFADKKRGGLLQAAIALIPAVFANGATALYWLLANPKARPGIYDLARSSNACSLTLWIARRLNIPTR
jgi:abequosyltransferase